MMTGDALTSVVYTSLLREGKFKTPRALTRPRCDDGGRVYGRWPRVKVRNSGSVVVVFRSLDPTGKRGVDGDVSVAAVDLSAPDPVWSKVRDLTDDDLTDKQPEAANAKLDQKSRQKATRAMYDARKEIIESKGSGYVWVMYQK